MAVEELLTGLWATPPAPLPFAPGLEVRAFLLQRAQGNVIVYNAPGLNDAQGEIQALGGATRQLVNHEHEAMFSPPDLGAPVYVHERDRASTARSLPVAGTFSERQMLDDDLELIPIPGHTPGSTAFLWDSGTHRFLFPGDSIWVQDGTWSAVVLDQRARDSYLESLALLAELDFDVLVPWGAIAGTPVVDVVSPAQARERIDAIIERVRAGGSA